MWMNDYYWDLEVYSFAVDSYLRSENPYLNRIGFDFLYHPLVLLALVKLNSLIHIGYLVPLLIMLSLYFYLRVFFEGVSKKWRNKSDLLRIFMLFMGFLGWGYLGVVSGNLSMLGHLTIQSIFFLYIKKKGLVYLILFTILVGLFAIIKPYFLAYLVMFLMVKRRVASFNIVFLIFFTLSAWFYGARIFPSMYQSFLTNLNSGTFSNEDLGLTLFSVLYPHVGLLKAIIVHTVLISVCMWVYCIRIKNSNSLSQFVWLSVISILANPRVKEYDLVLLLLLYFVLIYRQNKFNLKISINLLSNLNILCALCSSFLVLTTDLSVNYVLICGVAFVIYSIYKNALVLESALKAL